MKSKTQTSEEMEIHLAKMMGMSRYKNILILFLLSILTFTASIHKYFVGTGLRADIFLFYEYVTKRGDKGRFVSSIVYELNYMITIFVLLVLCRYLAVRKVVKNVISPFIGISFIDILDYFCFYKQLSYIKLPLLVLLVILFNRKMLCENIWKSK